MTKRAKKYKNIILLFVLFLFAEYLRVIGEADIEKSSENLIFCIIAIVWAVYLKRRIIDKKMQRILVGLAMSLVALFVVRTCKYVLFDKNTILWYMYYLPLTAMPLLAFFMSKVEIGKQQSHRLEVLGLVGLAIINLMILTNDLHQFVFRFTIPGNIDKYSYGIGYVITVVWIAGFAFAALFNLFKKCTLPQSIHKIWVPAIPMVVGIVLIILSTVGWVPVVNNTQIYLFQEIVLLMVIALVEALIMIGIIPSNDGYEEIFAHSRVNACIVNDDGEVVYASDNSKKLDKACRLAVKSQEVMIDDYDRLHYNSISGGTVFYTENIEEIVKLNHMLEEAAQVIGEENTMLEAENQLLRDTTMYRTKNKLYDDIARIVRPQVLLIEECLDGCEKEPEATTSHMSKAAVLNAYIKRRINLSLIAMENDRIPLSELFLAMSESLNYLKYCDVVTDIDNALGEAQVTADFAIAVYDCFESIIEGYYDNMSAVMVTFADKADSYAVVIALETDKAGSLLPKLTSAYQLYEAEDMIRVTIDFQREGDSHE